MTDGTDRQTSTESTQEKIEAQHERAKQLGDISPEALLLVLTEQMRDVLVHVRELTREVVAVRADLEDQDPEEVLSEVTGRLERASGEEELLRLKSIYDFLEERSSHRKYPGRT